MKIDVDYLTTENVPTNGVRAWKILRKSICFAVVVAMLGNDVANAGKSGRPTYKDDSNVGVRTRLLPSLRKTKSYGDLSKVQGTAPQSSVLQPLHSWVPTGSDHSKKSKEEEKTPLTSSKDSDEFPANSSHTGSSTNSPPKSDEKSKTLLEGSKDSNDSPPKGSPPTTDEEKVVSLTSSRSSEEDVVLLDEQLSDPKKTGNQSSDDKLKKMGSRGERKELQFESDLLAPSNGSTNRETYIFEIHEGSFSIHKGNGRDGKRRSLVDKVKDLVASSEEEGKDGPTETTGLLNSEKKKETQRYSQLSQTNQDNKSIQVIDEQELSLVDPSLQKRPFWPKPPYLIRKGELPTLLSFLEDIKKGKPSQNQPNLEEFSIIPFNQEAVNALVLKLEQLPPKAKSQLKRITEQDVEGKITKTDIAGILLGTGLAAWLSEGMDGVFAAGLDYLANYSIFYQDPWMGIYNKISTASTPLVITTVILDAWPRNVGFWKKTLTSLKEGEFSKGRIAGTVLLSFGPSILEPFYLILLDLQVLHDAEEQGFTPEPSKEWYVNDMLIWSWPLLIDSWAANANFAGEIWGDLIEEKFPVIHEFLKKKLFLKTLHTRLPSEEALLRRDFTKKLNKVSQYLYQGASKEEIQTIYDAVKGAKTEIQEKFSDLTEDVLQNAQGFFTLRYLLSFSEKIKEMKKQVKSWYDTITEGIIGFNVITGSPARLLVFELIVESITNLIPGNAPLTRGFANWGTAAFISTIQTVFEAYGMSAFFKNFLAQEEPHGHTIYKGARIPAKVYAGTIALIYTGLLVSACLQVVDTWKFDYSLMSVSIPFLFAEFATQAASQWGWSSQQEVSLFARVHNLVTRKCLGKAPRTMFKRDEMVELVKTFKERIPYLSPQTLHILNQTLLGEGRAEEMEEM